MPNHDYRPSQDVPDDEHGLSLLQHILGLCSVTMLRRLVRFKKVFLLNAF